MKYLRRHLGLTESLPAATRACAENDLIAALAGNGHEDEARVVLNSSSIVLEKLSPPERVERLRVCQQLGAAIEPDRVVEPTDISELSPTSAVGFLLDAVEGHEIEESGALFEALAVAMGRVDLDDARGLDEKRLVRCAGQYERASRAADAAACWKVVWLQRKNSRGENHPKAQAALRQFTRLTGHSHRTQDRFVATMIRQLRTMCDRFRGRRRFER